MTDNILILLGVVFLIFLGVSVPFLIQILRTAREMTQILRLLNDRLPLIMTNLEEITTNLNRTSTTIDKHVAEISLTLGRIQGIVGLLLSVEEVVRQRMGFPVTRLLQTSRAVGKGIRVFVDTFTGIRS